MLLTWFDEKKEEESSKEEARKRKCENESNEGSDVKRKRGEGEEKLNDFETILEGDDVTEMVIQRPIVNEIMTQLNEVSQFYALNIYVRFIPSSLEYL
ncbi:hypothetical protein Avbf_13640 [Armadillidium vulgare]|nr:hypothetical protein Avbf_13640 [Armadillidium vulgare]